jgi:putative ABC transport system permease protein
MNELFGVPMGAIAAVLAALLGVCLLVVGWIAWRQPVMFRLGARNIPRRPAETTLILIGLMLSTAIIAAALGSGDTVDASLSADVYRSLGPVDALVVAKSAAPGGGAASAPAAGIATFPQSAFEQVARRVAGDPAVVGLAPLLEARRPVRNMATNLAEPNAALIGLDPAHLAGFPLETPAGAAIDLAALPPDGVVLSQRLATALDAKPGDRLALYSGLIPAPAVVAAVARDSYLTGVRPSPGGGSGVGMVMPLARLQTLTGQGGRISAIAVSAGGGQVDVSAADAATADLDRLLAGSPLGVNPLKRTLTDQAARVASIFTALFALLGLFAIAAGVLLIVLIFTLLASERRPEMGMARAVGAQRSQLMQQFLAEGVGYALLSGLAGALIGVLAAWGIATAMRRILGDAAPIEPAVTPRSLLVAYCLGVVITFATIAVASWRISRLEIVAAIRNLPDRSSPVGRRRTLMLAALTAALAVALVAVALRTRSEFAFYAGVSLAPFAVAAGSRWLGAPRRPLATLAGLALLAFWLTPEAATERLVGRFDGSIEMFFLAGVAITVATTLVIVANLDLMLAAIDRLGDVWRGGAPVVRMAVAYPGAAPARTGLTIAMFSLIVFSLIVTATISRNIVAIFLGNDAGAGWDVEAQALGIDPLPQPAEALARAGVAPDQIRAIGETISPGLPLSKVRVAGSGETGWKSYLVQGMDDAFLDATDFAFSQRARGYDSDAAVVAALRRDPSLAVVDGFALPNETGFARTDVFRLTGLDPGSATFEPTPVEIASPSGGAPQRVTVIGVIDRSRSGLVGLYTGRSTVLALAPARGFTAYSIALRDPAQAPAVARQIESGLLAAGVQATAIRDRVAESQRQTTGFLAIIQGFMGLGLIVGVAAVGVISFRSVVERRQHIGVLRAIGFRRELVARALLVESAFVVGLGVVAGSALAIALARNLFASGRLGVRTDTIATPWDVIALVLALAIGVALLMTWVPARQAAAIAPAEALRYE